MIQPFLEKAFAARAALVDPAHETAFRLFNGFSEGCPDLAVDVYAATAVIHDHASDPAAGSALVQEARGFLSAALPWLRCVIVKTRAGRTQAERFGQVVSGGEPDRKIREQDTWYAVNLTLNRDASFYLDTRNLRRWLAENLRGRELLNTFAYTGSFGAAALKGGASRVVQIDLDRRFLDLARSTYALNGFPIRKGELIARDFFEQVGNMKRTQTLFDCVILDPPFFSTTSRGRVDLEKENARLINKVRPLIRDGGTLVTVNNALFVSGRETMQTIEDLCADGYLKVRELIPVPEDVCGYPETTVGSPVTDPAPFNHSTKIVILDVKRKKEAG